MFWVQGFEVHVSGDDSIIPPLAHYHVNYASTSGDWRLETFQPLAYCFCSFVLYALPYRTNAYFFPLLRSFQIAATQRTEVLLYKSDLTGFQNLSGLAGADDFRL